VSADAHFSSALRAPSAVASDERPVRVLHVVASGDMRGGSVFASDLVRWMNQENVTQLVAVLRSRGRTEVTFDAPVEPLGPDSRRLPGLRISWTNLTALGALIRRWNPDVVQVHGGEPLKYAVLTAPSGHPPVVYRRIGAAPAWITKGVQRQAHGLLMRRAARVVAVADAVRREAIRLFGVAPRKIVTIPNAVDARRLKPLRGRDATRESLGIPQHVPVALSLAALTWEKDPLAHVDIAERVLKEEANAVHLIVGDGPMRTEIEEAIRTRGLEGRVLPLGRRSDVADLLAASDVLVFASRSDGMEGMPASLIEAGMLGVPAAAYAIVGVPEVVLDGTTGLLVSPGDRQGLARRVLELIRNDAERRSMGEQARDRCRSMFDMPAVGPAYLALYRSLVRSR
jgi:glycosyltransferase involved in cell wall biosynthesis